MSTSHTVSFVRNQHGEQEVSEYLKRLARQRWTGGFEATEVLLRIAALEHTGPVGEPVLVIDETIALHALFYEVHVVIHAPHPQERDIFLLTAFREEDWERGIRRAEELARRLFGLTIQ